MFSIPVLGSLTTVAPLKLEKGSGGPARVFNIAPLAAARSAAAHRPPAPLEHSFVVFMIIVTHINSILC